MKKIAIIIAIPVVLLAIAVPTLYFLRESMSNKMNNHETVILDDEDRFISLHSSEGIVSLEEGLLAVRHDGDYGFDAFLAQGGASSDKELLEFFTSYFGLTGDNIQLHSQPYGCSTISAKNESGGYLFGRNFDWMSCDAMIVEAHPSNGYNSISTVNLDFIHMGTRFLSVGLPDEALTIAALYVPMDGINEKGLAVSVNMIQDSATIQQNTDRPDITTTTAIRLLLDKAANVEEALALLAQYDLHASMNFMVHFAIADAEGNSVAVEYINNQMVVTPTPVLTNFYLAEGEKQGIGTTQSHTRFEILSETLASHDVMTHEQIRDVLDSVSKHNYQDSESTEWSIVFDQSAMTATYYHRENYAQKYEFSLLPSQ